MFFYNPRLHMHTIKHQLSLLQIVKILIYIVLICNSQSSVQRPDTLLGTSVWVLLFVCYNYQSLKFDNKSGILYHFGLFLWNCILLDLWKYGIKNLHSLP